MYHFPICTPWEMRIISAIAFLVGQIAASSISPTRDDTTQALTPAKDVTVTGSNTVVSIKHQKVGNYGGNLNQTYPHGVSIKLVEHHHYHGVDKTSQMPTRDPVGSSESAEDTSSEFSHSTSESDEDENKKNLHSPPPTRCWLLQPNGSLTEIPYASQSLSSESSEEATTSKSSHKHSLKTDKKLPSKSQNSIEEIEAHSHRIHKKQHGSSHGRQKRGINVSRMYPDPKIICDDSFPSRFSGENVPTRSSTTGNDFKGGNSIKIKSRKNDSSSSSSSESKSLENVDPRRLNLKNFKKPSRKYPGEHKKEGRYVALSDAQSVVNSECVCEDDYDSSDESRESLDEDDAKYDKDHVSVRPHWSRSLTKSKSKSKLARMASQFNSTSSSQKLNKDSLKPDGEKPQVDSSSTSEEAGIPRNTSKHDSQKMGRARFKVRVDTHRHGNDNSKESGEGGIMNVLRKKQFSSTFWRFGRPFNASKDAENKPEHRGTIDEHHSKLVPSSSEWEGPREDSKQKFKNNRQKYKTRKLFKLVSPNGTEKDGNETDPTGPQSQWRTSFRHLDDDDKKLKQRSRKFWRTNFHTPEHAGDQDEKKPKSRPRKFLRTHFHSPKYAGDEDEQMKAKTRSRKFWRVHLHAPEYAGDQNEETKLKYRPRKFFRAAKIPENSDSDESLENFEQKHDEGRTPPTTKNKNLEDKTGEGTNHNHSEVKMKKHRRRLRNKGKDGSKSLRRNFKPSGTLVSDGKGKLRCKCPKRSGKSSRELGITTDIHKSPFNANPASILVATNKTETLAVTPEVTAINTEAPVESHKTHVLLKLKIKNDKMKPGAIQVQIKPKGAPKEVYSLNSH